MLASILKQLGTYQVAVLAKAHGKPFYVAAESYKFTRTFPFRQRDVAPLYEANNVVNSDDFNNNDAMRNLDCNFSDDNNTSTIYDYSSIDFTPSEYITLLFTDLGSLTPAAVSDELTRLYQ